MPLTRDFKETIKARVQRDSGFRASLLEEAINLLLAGDVGTGKSILRTYVNATVGFEELAQHIALPSKSLMRMLSQKGNPRADHLFAIIRALQDQTGVNLTARAA